MSAIFLKSATNVEQLPKSDKPQIALVGRSNVGKSSLLNHLTGIKGLARESATPGRTQHINVFEVDKTYHLIDLPGYGFAQTSKTKRDSFGEMVRDYLWQSHQLKLVLLIIDARHGPSDLDREMIAYLLSGRIPFVMIVNKFDKLSHSEGISLLQKLDSDFAQLPMIAHSNITGKGRGDILKYIDQVVKL